MSHRGSFSLPPGDPLPRVRQWLVSQNMLNAAAESALRHEVDAEVGAALAPAR